MKYMNMKEKFLPLNLQFFADGGEGGDGDGAGEGDDQDDDDADEDGEDEDEKKYSQKDMDDAVKKRLAREKRKWQREQQKEKDKGKKDGDDEEESEDSKARKAAEDRASKAEVKIACYEAGVSKDSVDDVVALARSYMAADEDLDLEEAIEKVVKKYPQFKNDAADQDDEEDSSKKKAWAERQKGKGSKKMSGVEKRFYELNPDLK